MESPFLSVKLKKRTTKIGKKKKKKWNKYSI